MGFAVAHVPTWTRFVATGELARTLARACVLDGRLGYQLVDTAGALALRVSFEGAWHDIAIADTGDVASGLAGILRAINAITTGPQLVLVGRDRIELGDPAALAGVVEASVAARVSAASDRALPAVELPRMPEDGSPLGLVASYVERLAVFAGLEGVTCQPRWTQDPDLLTFTFVHRPPGSGGLQLTLRVPYIPELDPQPILDALNGRLRDDRRLYRAATGPDRVDVILADRTTAAMLRARGELIENPARDALRAIADAGVELASLYGEWRNAAFAVFDALRRLTPLARGVADITATARLTDDDAVEIAWRVGDHRETTRYGAELGGLATVEVLPRVIADLNRMLAGSTHRCVVMTGEPFFYGHRMLLLDRAWLAAVTRGRGVLPGCIDDATLASLARVIGAYPPAELAGSPPRLPRLDELVRREDIAEHDFKCSSRPHDMAELIDEIARFARIVLDVGDIIQVDDGFAFAVAYRGAPATIQLEDRKYVDVGPVLDYLNAILATRTPRHQLYRYRGGGYSGGLVRATDDEAAQLSAAGYT